MPGIADAPVTPLNLQRGSSAEIGGAPIAPANINPGVGDLFANFKNGFITADDIRKREVQRPVEAAQAQQALADLNTIRPKQREVAAKNLDIQSTSLDTQAQTQPKLDAASILQAEQILGEARLGNDKKAILNFHQTVSNPGQLPPRIDPNDPTSEYDWGKIEETNGGFLTKQRELQAAGALGKFVKTFTTKQKDAFGNETESVVRLNEATGETLGSTPIGSSPTQKTPILAEELTRLANVESVMGNLQDVKRSFTNLFKQNPELVGPIAGRVVGPLLGQYNAAYQLLESAITKTVPGLARGIFGEVGVLTDADVERYRSLLPSAKKDAKVAFALFKEIEETVARRRIALLDAMEDGGRDIRAFRRVPRVPPPDTAAAAPGTAAAAPGAAAPGAAASVIVTASPEEAEALPPGTRYLTPGGLKRIR